MITAGHCFEEAILDLFTNQDDGNCKYICSVEPMILRFSKSNTGQQQLERMLASASYVRLEIMWACTCIEDMVITVFNTWFRAGGERVWMQEHAET
ncbi:hypothetical protein BU25DRAFT_406435 [Macroventuria anomochaeta]|uniref:Uncharacterized protein n=1 Tax=Macroventuria anomochaeta TaxID=301207 RepID=A0ACB6SCZ2_9PLEO|nr:uncharacterized protein BU25DRAFT_406435 [Macroventuria anomochaeta]KAF2631909.1 hypothetical protein BU25DRAFT_406435 [Macroventuria anomochaeta]